jgi:hypothetical protein
MGAPLDAMSESATLPGMAWSDEFWKPIKLKDGRSVATLAEARVLILSLPGSKQ